MNLSLPFFYPQTVALPDKKSYPIFHFTEEIRKTAPNCKWTIIGKPPAMLDYHVAEVYQKETNAFNQQVERNKEYFKEEWRFRPTVQEWNILKSLVNKALQEDVTLCDILSQVFGRKVFSHTPPWFYTEKGVDMAAFFQKTPAAKQYAIFIVEAFQKFKEHLFQTVQKKSSITIEISNQFEACKRMAETSGLTGNQAILAASKAVITLTGYDPLELLGQQQLTCVTQEVHLAPTAIGKMLGLSPQKTNTLLEKAGLQESFRDAKNKKCWKPTEKGKTFAVLKDTNKKHSDGVAVQQLMWLESVISVLKTFGQQAEFAF